MYMYTSIYLKHFIVVLLYEKTKIILGDETFWLSHIYLKKWLFIIFSLEIVITKHSLRQEA